MGPVVLRDGIEPQGAACKAFCLLQCGQGPGLVDGRGVGENEQGGGGIEDGRGLGAELLQRRAQVRALAVNAAASDISAEQVHVLQAEGVGFGYILGYLPCAAVISLLCGRFESKKAVFPLSMILGTVICYAVGTAWYILQTKSSVAAALSVCILPFLLGDIIKITSAACISVALRPKLEKILK